MNNCDTAHRERAKLDRLISFRLPHYFFRLGILIFVIILVALAILKWQSGDHELLRQVLRHLMLFGLLAASLAADAEEDEMILSLRGKSYTAAFIIGVCYIWLEPFIDYGVDRLIGNAAATIEDSKGLAVLLFMLTIQLGFYHSLKRIYR